MAENRFISDDRILGDAWHDWKPGKSPKVLPLPGKRMYLVFVLSIFWGGLSIAWGMWFLSSPRLAQIHPLLPKITCIGSLALMAGMGTYGIMVILSLLIRRNLGVDPRRVGLFLTSLFPLCQRIGQRLGIEKDRLAHSFLRVTNALHMLTAWKFHPSDLLILLPRCLDPSIQHPIRAFAEKQGIPLRIVPGGESARETIRNIQPKAVIGVACERDLIDGIRDVLPFLPVFGIPNQRPEGPCKNTRLDLVSFEDALRCFLGRPVQIPLRSEDG